MGSTGCLCPPGDPQALAKILRRLADHPEERARLAEAGRARARDFTPDIVAAKVFAVYETLVGWEALDPELHTTIKRRHPTALEPGRSPSEAAKR